MSVSSVLERIKEILYVKKCFNNVLKNLFSFLLVCLSHRFFWVMSSSFPWECLSLLSSIQHIPGKEQDGFNVSVFMPGDICPSCLSTLYLRKKNLSNKTLMRFQKNCKDIQCKDELVLFCGQWSKVTVTLTWFCEHNIS